MRRVRMIWHPILLVTFIVILAVVISRKAVFSGQLEIVQAAGQKTPYLDQLLPTDRAQTIPKDSHGQFRVVIGQPVYFDLRPPRSFDQAEVELTYQANQNLSLGIARGPDNQFDLKPIDNSTLDEILNDSHWTSQNEDNTYFFQNATAPVKFKDLSDFLNSMPVKSRIGVLNYNLQPFFHIQDYQPSAHDMIIDRSMRGYHAILTYIKNEPLQFTFRIQDINRREGEDHFEVLVYHNDDLIYNNQLDDDEITGNTGPVTPPRQLHLSLPGLPEGVYKIILNCDDDIFIRQIKTRQSKVVFANTLYLTDNAEYHDGFPDLRTDSTTVYASAPILSAYTSHYRGLQTLKINGAEVQLNQTHTETATAVTAAVAQPYPVQSPKNDVKFSGRGVFAFSREAFFNPNFINLEGSDGADLDYIVANYTPPEPLGDLKTAHVNFDLTQAYKNDDKIRLILSAPQISKDNPVKIYKMKVVLTGEPLSWSDLWEKLW
ncbi:hypothetical protein HY224_01575 [Candidatus Uhrbacteria bacterium]|nr:hypothetical protein [Candidatus Uhrbacteria bacterium]